MSIRIGTRGSKLALTQTGTVAQKLSELGIETEQVIIHTEGDSTTQVPLHEIGGQGVFVRALDDAILAGEIDCAVHSMKDIPAYRPSGAHHGSYSETGFAGRFHCLPGFAQYCEDRRHIEHPAGAPSFSVMTRLSR